MQSYSLITINRSERLNSNALLCPNLSFRAKARNLLEAARAEKTTRKNRIRLLVLAIRADDHDPSRPLGMTQHPMPVIPNEGEESG